MSAPARVLRSFKPAPHHEAPASHSAPPCKRRTQAWLALHFFDWPLWAALFKLPQAERANAETHPIAVLDADRQRRVLCCSAAAWRQGVRPGHSLNAAIALCKEMRFFERDPGEEVKQLRHMALWAQQYTPYVSIAAPNELLLEVRGSLRLFGGAASLTEKIQQALRDRGMRASGVLSATAQSALWLSRVSAGTDIVPPRKLKTRLAQLPLCSLCWPEDIELRLTRFGVLTVGDLMRLPRADLARRIDAQCIAELNCALGRKVEARPAFQPPESYADRTILDSEIAAAELLEPVLGERLQILQRYLQGRSAALGDVDIALLHRESAVTSLRMGLAAPTADMKYFAKLLHERLMQLSLPAPVLEIRLRVARLYAARGGSAELFQAGAEDVAHLTREERRGRLLECLRARLGETAIHALRPCADYRPEKAQAYVPAAMDFEPAQASPPMTLAQRPLWLLREPQLIGRGSECPEGMYFVKGPERIQAGWWDKAPLHRDYYVAKNKAGALCWIFREHAPPGRWYLQGFFG